ncbi:hypothetical protein SmJEL517_g00700 [Synchytrium microbalum]|uniref:Integrator complex subunit 2 n=1 Tax=Synchytrium microbalum TaxID=1806994 RepID=A0A507CE76_9FUNG|nr:uncharacterized protein SmJEL517_g00700 [Synchytrium microbalum]TPX37479.1 hypothetical protein SmJEL517_g00700 [Synchytrium microbalum]
MSIDLSYVATALSSDQKIQLPRNESERFLAVLNELTSLSKCFHSDQKSTDLPRPSDFMQSLSSLEIAHVVITSLKLFKHLIQTRDLFVPLLFLSQCREIFHQVIPQCPNEFLIICRTLVHVHRNELLAENTRALMKYACGVGHQKLLRYMLMEAKVLPDLCCYLTITYLHDEVLFLNSILDTNMSWTFETVDQLPHTSGSTLLIKDYLPALVDRVVNGIQQASPVDVKMRLRALCGFVGIYGVVLSDAQLDSIVVAIAMNANESSGGQNLSFPIVCWMQMVRRFNEMTTVEMVSTLLQTTRSHVTMLICIHIFTDSPVKVAEQLRNHLEMNVTIPSQTFSKMCEAFRSRLLNVKKLCHRALELRVEDEEVQTKSESISISLVSQMLAAEMFHKAQVDVGPWMQRVITDRITLPLHSSLLQLLTIYVESILTTTFATRIPDSVVRQTFDDSNELKPSHVIMLLYVLLHDFSLVAGIRNIHGDQIYALAGKRPYPTRLADSLPIKRVLLFARTHDGGKTYSSIYPQLYSLINGCYPELLEPLSLSCEESVVQSASLVLPSTWYAQQLQPTGGAISAQAIGEYLLRPALTTKVFEYLVSLTPQQLLPYHDIFLEYIVPVLPLVEWNDPIWPSFSNIWQKLNSVKAPDTWVKTIKILSLHRPDIDLLDLQSLIENPQNQVDVDRRVYRRPVLFGILLQILTCLLAAARSPFRKQVRVLESPHITPMEVERAEPSIIHFLLDACLASPEDERTADASTILKQIRRSTCDYIHSRFCNSANKDLIRTINQRGYAIELIPILVKGIPSMHVVDVMLIQLYNTSPVDKSPFITELARHISDNNPTARIMDLVRQAVFPYVDRMCGSLPGYNKFIASEPTEAILPAPPSLQAFPSMDYLPQVLRSLVELTGVFWDDYQQRTRGRLNDLEVPFEVADILARTPSELMDARHYEFLERIRRAVRDCQQRMRELAEAPRKKQSNR